MQAFHSQLSIYLVSASLLFLDCTSGTRQSWRMS